MITTVVDFESFYDTKNGISAGQQGVANYTACADAYIVSVVDDQGLGWCGTIEEARIEFPESFWRYLDRQVWAANSNFDYTFAQKYFPEVSEGKPWKCVLDLAKFNQLPHFLAGVVKTVYKQKLDKSIRDGMDGRHFDDLKEEEQIQLQEYCLNDSVVTLKLVQDLPKMSPVEERLAEHTRMTCRRGVHIDIPKVDADMTLLKEVQHAALQHIPWRNDSKPLSPLALARFCTAQGLPKPKSTAKGDEECEDFMDVHPQLMDVIGAMRDFRRCNVALKKGALFQAYVKPDGTMPMDLLYCGAPHTRRWSSKGINLQNLLKDPWVIEGEFDKKAGNHQKEGVHYVWPRHWVTPRPGKKFLIFDLAQIEPRCLNWIVGNEDMLEAVRAGYGIYEAYAQAFKRWRGNAGTLKITDPKLYANCKAEVLGLGYGMGHTKYRVEAAKSGVILDFAQANEAVARFRKDNPKVPAMWSKFNHQISSAMLSKSKQIDIEMPTGDWLRHFDVCEFRDPKTRKQGYRSTVVKGLWDHNSVLSIWGGVLFQNCVQRMARDVLAESILRLEDAGLPVIFHAHDEVIIEVDEDDKTVQDGLRTAEEIMKKEPEWAEGLPLGVEGGVFTSYTK